MNAPIVTTTHGKVKGELYGGTAVFRGIPYGSAGAKRRFLPPLPAENWEGIRDCTENGPIAWQAGGSISGQQGFGRHFSGSIPERFRCDREVMDEDCLVLNTVTPGIDDKKRPVVVYIHGGGYASGSGSLVLGADTWAREEDIVVVGINHRLNVFGYLYLGWADEKYAASGVAGLLDLVLALEWVRDNIAAFGGDPEKVTIMGESGGGGKVNHLLAMPAAKGLFRAAIIESGSGAPATLSKEKAQQAAQQLLKALGIPENDLSALLALPPETVFEASIRPDIYMGFVPSADGSYLAYNEAAAYVECNPALPMLVGASEEEMAAFLDVHEVIGWEQLIQKLTAGTGRDRMALPALTAEKAEQVIRVFRENDTKNADAQHLYCRIVSLGGRMGGNAYKQALAKAQKQAGAVYNYLIAFDAPHPFEPQKRFAWHTADLPLQMRIVADAECEEVSRTMGRAWGAFIRTGSPDTPQLRWPAFTAEDPNVMVIDDICRIEQDPTRPYREALED